MLTRFGFGRIRRVGTTLSRRIVSYTYTPGSGILETVTSPDSITMTFEYDGSLLTKTTWSGEVAGSVTLEHNNDLLIRQQRVNEADPIDYDHDRDQLMTQAGALSITLDNASGLTTGTTLDTVSNSHSYSSFGELAGLEASTSGIPLYQASYTRDRLGRISQLDKTVEGVTRMGGIPPMPWEPSGTGSQFVGEMSK